MDQETTYLLVVGGPTAAGKTGLAIQLAQHFQTHIVSADSRQIYRELSIGTAKPSPEELAKVPHHFIDHISLMDTWSVGEYERQALDVLKELFEHHRIVVLTGGTGLYIRALCQGLDAFPEVPPKVKARWMEQFEKKGLSFLQNALKQQDPQYFEEVDLQNPHRLIRALSVCEVSDRPFSSFRKQQPARRAFTPLYYWIHWERELLYERINRRVDQMIAHGLLEEVRGLYEHKHRQALQTVGYQEIIDYLDGKHDWEEAVRLIKRNTRRYAKRQITWMRRDDHWQLISPEGVQDVIEQVEAKVRTLGKG